MNFINAGYAWKNAIDYKSQETIDARFGNRVRIIFIRSSCFVKIDNNPRCEYKKNTLFIAGSGMHIEWGSLENGECYIDDWMEFSAEESELAEFGLKLGIVVPEIPNEYAKVLSKSFRYLALEQFNKEVYYHIAINARLNLFLVDLARYVNSNTVYDMKQNHSHPYYQKLLKMREFILNNVFENYSIEQICRENNMSVSHFRRLYKEIFNNSINKDVLARKVDLAQQMIRKNPNESISQIIDMLGYEYHETFFRQFKQRVGVTPLEYKRRCIETEKSKNIRNN